MCLNGEQEKNTTIVQFCPLGYYLRITGCPSGLATVSLTVYTKQNCAGSSWHIVCGGIVLTKQGHSENMGILPPHRISHLIPLLPAIFVWPWPKSRKSLLASWGTTVCRNLVKLCSIPKSWFFMLENKLYFSHLMLFSLWGRKHLTCWQGDTLQFTSTPPLEERNPKSSTTLQIANNLKVTDLGEMTEDCKQLDSLFSRGQ